MFADNFDYIESYACNNSVLVQRFQSRYDRLCLYASTMLSYKASRSAFCSLSVNAFMSGSPTVSMMRFVFSNIFLPPFFLYDIFQTRQNLSSSKKKIENGRKYFRHTAVKCNSAHHWAISIVVIVFLIITYSYLALSFQRLRLYFYSTAYILTERVALHKELEIGFGVQWKGNLAVWGTTHSQYKSKEKIIKRLWQKMA